MSEQWKDIPGYEGFYQASDEGRLKRLGRKDKVLHYSRLNKEAILKVCWSSTCKYGIVNIKANNVRKTKMAHVLIALTWVENPDNKPFVNHKDGDKTNLHPSNLEWSTKAGNNQHAYDTGLRGRKNKIPKVTCSHCGLLVGSNMLKRHIEARHLIIK